MALSFVFLDSVFGCVLFCFSDAIMNINVVFGMVLLMFCFKLDNVYLICFVVSGLVY